MFMARPLRIEFPGAMYHITSRGNARSAIYLDDADRASFLEQLGSVCQRYNWRCHAYCLMTNHYHLVIETGDATLSRGMRQLNGVYTQAFNRRHQRVGHVFQGRYKAILVDRDAYLLEVIRYVLLNPVRAHMTRTAGQYRWSSYRAMLGKTEAPDWLAREWVLSQFANTRKAAQQQFIRFIRAGRNQPRFWEQLRHQIYLGDEQFIEQVQQHLSPEQSLAEIPRLQHRQVGKSLAHYAKQYPAREAMRRAHENEGYTFKAIADYFGVHYSTVSRAVTQK
jgi:putative transposase